jgi:hypothetical protein
MKKTKRILALIGAILLLLLYVVAFVATVLDHTSDMRYWKACRCRNYHYPGAYLGVFICIQTFKGF